MELEDNYSLLQDNVISILRNYPRFLTLLKAIYPRFDNLQDCANFLSDALRIERAEGVWLDYIGWLVGINRTYINLTNYFSVNHRDVNVEKLFWFKDQKTEQVINLQDELFRRRIYAKIAYNTSKCTREENISVIKNMYYADKVIIKVVEPMLLDITLYGDDILETSTMLEDITSILGNGVGIRHLYIRGLAEYGND